MRTAAIKQLCFTGYIMIWPKAGISPLFPTKFLYPTFFDFSNKNSYVPLFRTKILIFHFFEQKFLFSIFSKKFLFCTFSNKNSCFPIFSNKKSYFSLFRIRILISHFFYIFFSIIQGIMEIAVEYAISICNIGYNSWQFYMEQLSLTRRYKNRASNGR